MRRLYPRRSAFLNFVVLAALLAAGCEGAAAQDSRRREQRQKPADFQGTVAFSEAPTKLLEKAVRYLVYLPKGYDQPENANRRYPTLFYLHGLFESAERWESRGGTELIDSIIRKGDLPPVIAVVPDGRSFYVDSLDGKMPYARFFIEEFIPFVDATYRTDARREARVIIGHSMGGAGALRFAFRHGELFLGVAAHSAAILPKDLDDASDRTKRTMEFVSQRFKSVFGDPVDRAAYRSANPLTVAEDVKIDPRLKIWFDCGEQDDYEFDDGARALDELLKAKKIPHVAKILPGDHGWDYIRSSTPASLKFLGDALKEACMAGPSNGAQSRPAKAEAPKAPKKP